MTEEEFKLYHKKKSHEHYIAHKNEYHERQESTKNKDPDDYAMKKKMSREKHRPESNLRQARRRYETKRDAELSGEVWLQSEDEKLIELYALLREKKIKQIDIARQMGRSLPAIANRAKKIGLTQRNNYEQSNIC